MASPGETYDKDRKTWKGTDRRQMLSEEFEKLMTKIEETVTSEQEQKVQNTTGMLTSELNIFKRKVNIQESEINKLRQKERSFRKQIARKDEQISQLNLECENLKSSHSKQITNQLTDVNPNIPDLSDANRPLKLAEKYNELYDNEWTDAFETVQKDRKSYHYSEEELEKEAISILLQVIKEVWQCCKDESREQDMQIREALLRERDDKRNLPEEFTRQLKSMKKELAIHSTDAIYEKFLRRKPRVSDYLVSHIQAYVKECTKLCWLMTNQDPPMDFEMITRTYDSFDSKKYREYMKRGSYVEFVVWPPMLLHKNGPVMAKGVAQGLTLTSKEDVSPKYGDYAVENKAYPITKTNQDVAYDDYGKLSRKPKPVNREIILEQGKDDVHGNLGKYGDDTVEKGAYPITKIKQKEACAGQDDKVSRYQKPLLREVIPELSRDDAYENIGNAGARHNIQTQTSLLKIGANEETRGCHQDVDAPVNHHQSRRQSPIWSREMLWSKLYEGSSRYLPSNAEYDRYLHYLDKGWSRKLIRNTLGDVSYERCKYFDQLLIKC